MGIRTLKEVNRVYGFKIIWRLLTRDSLWGKWLQNNLLKNKCFWEVKEDIQAGSWMWRLLTGNSLWGKWLQNNLLKKKCFWEVKKNTEAGSWMWRKIIKLRDTAKGFRKKEVENGCNTSFWYDNWSTKGVIVEILGSRGVIDMGISNEATVAEDVLGVRRRRRHRTELLNAIESEMVAVKEKLWENVEDVSL